MVKWKKRRIGAYVVITFLSWMPLLASCDSKSAEQHIRDAKADRAAGKISAAIIDVKNALQKEPKNLEARILLARFYLDLPDPTSAEAELQRARQDGADATLIAKPLADAELMLGKPQLAIKETEIADTAAPTLKASLLAARGSALLASGEKTEAQSVLEAALQADPQSIDALAAMARYSLERGDWAAARQRLADAQKLDAKNLTVLSLQGAVAFSAGEAAEAERTFQDMLAVAPWSLPARLGVARAQIVEGKFKEAIGALDIVLKSAPNDPNANYLRALAAFRQQDYSTAQQHLQKTLGVSKNFAPALMLAGATSYALKQYEQANSYLSQYVYKVPQNAQATKLLAATQIALGHPADAVKTLAPSAQGSEDAQLLAMIGEASARAGDLSSASRYLGQAVEKEPSNAALRTQLGAIKVALGQTDAGVEELQKAAEQDPSALRPEVALFSAYMRNKLYDKALDVAQRVQQGHPKGGVGFDLEGLIDIAKNDTDSARKSFLKARELQPNDALALRMLAGLEFRAKNYQVAGQYLQETLKSNPKNTQAYVDLAEIERVQNQPQQMVATLRQAVEQNPDVVVTRILLGRVLLVTGKPQDALEAVQPALLKDPQNGPALEVQGEAQLVLRNADGAIATFTTLVGAQPQASAAHKYLAQAYAAAGKLELAIGEGQKAVELAPKDIMTSLELVRTYMAKKDFKSAQGILDKLTTENPNNPSILAITGQVAMAAGRPDDAVAAYTLALDIADSGIIRGQLAAAEAAAGRFGDAENMLRPWVEEHPDDFNGRMGLADLYLTERHLEDAANQYEILVKKNPDNAIAENNLAWTLSLLGRNPDALTHVRHAAALAPNSPDVLDTLVVVLLQGKNTTEALATAQKAAALAPNNLEIQFHLAQVLVQSGDKEKARALLKGLLDANQAFTDRDTAEQLMNQIGG